MLVFKARNNSRDRYCFPPSQCRKPCPNLYWPKYSEFLFLTLEAKRRKKQEKCNKCLCTLYLSAIQKRTTFCQQWFWVWSWWMLVFTAMLLQHALNTPNEIIFSAKLKTPPTCLSIEKELRQEPDVRSAGTSSTQTRAPKEFCNTKHGRWMNLHILRIRQLLKHRLSWNCSTQAHPSNKNQFENTEAVYRASSMWENSRWIAH